LLLLHDDLLDVLVAAERRNVELLVLLLLLLPEEESEELVALCGSVVLGELARFLPRIVCIIVICLKSDVISCLVIIMPPGLIIMNFDSVINNRDDNHPQSWGCEESGTVVKRSMRAIVRSEAIGSSSRGDDILVTIFFYSLRHDSVQQLLGSHYMLYERN
jgi:hypothetical protein